MLRKDKLKVQPDLKLNKEAGKNKTRVGDDPTLVQLEKELIKEFAPESKNKSE